MSATENESTSIQPAASEAEPDSQATEIKQTQAATETATQEKQSIPSANTSATSTSATNTPEDPAVKEPTTLPEQEKVTSTSNASTVHARQPLPPMQIEDLRALKIGSDPQLSPDSRFILFSQLACARNEDATTSAIWLIDIDEPEAGPRQLSAGTAHDRQARWSPDGKTIAFLSDRTGTTQLYTLPFNGGEARCLTQFTHDIRDYSWHPSGQMLLVQSAWKPLDDTQKKDASATHTYTHLNERWDGEGERDERHQQLWLVPLTGQPRRLTSEPVDFLQACWSPDGQQIACCANRRADSDLSVSMALWILTLATGKLRRLTQEDGLAQMPSWSPDGKQIAYLYSPDQTEASNITPWIVNADGTGAPHLATPEAGNYTSQAWIIDELRSEYLCPPRWYPDSKALLLPFQIHGQLHLYRIDLDKQQMQRLTQGNGRYISPQLSKDGQRITMVRADWFTPGDIWYIDSASHHMRKVTSINDELLQHRYLTRPQRISWQSFDGQTIEGLLYLPPVVPGDRVPLILAPHGGPSLAWGDSYIHEFQVLAGRGIAVLAPNPRGSAGYGENFSRSILNDWGGDDVKDLLAGLDYVIAHEPIDEQRLGVGGMSYGGYMTNWIISQDLRFKAAVSRNGISSLATATLLSDQTIWLTLSMEDSSKAVQRSALTFVDKIHTPLLLLHGEDDLRCPVNESRQLFVALRKRKQPAELITYSGASHLMDWPDVGTPEQRIDRLRRTVQWFERFLAAR